MCEIKTGDEVLVSADGCLWNERIFLYTRLDGYHLCQRRNDYEVNAVAKFGAWKHIKPAPKYENRALGPVAMMQALIDRGYVPDRCGDWTVPDNDYYFDASMWVYCGKPSEENTWTWEPWMLEKVEVKP